VREALTLADVGADSVDRVEHGLEQLVAMLERLLERLHGLVVCDQVHQCRLIQVLRPGSVQGADQHQVGDDGAGPEPAADDQCRRQSHPERPARVLPSRNIALHPSSFC
jgi:hypothetical protein